MQEIREKLARVILDLYDLEIDFDLTASPEGIDADYSSNAPLKLAKTLHKSPMEIAGEIGGKIETKITPPGFLNFSLSDEYLTNEVLELTHDYRKNISSTDFSDKTVICEFSDPNPFKILHVGHLYTSVFGDVVSRLYEFSGAKVVRANFGGDVGLHVAKTMYALEKKQLKDFTINDISESYIEGTRFYEEDEFAKKEITKLNKEIYKINAEKLHDTKLAQDYWKGRELSYNYFREFYDSIGVKFDKYYPESSVAELGFKTVQEQLGKGVYEYSDGAVIFDGDKYGLHTRVFINKEGVPTYETKDVGLIFTKWQDYHFDKSVVITGNEQTDYMKVVLKSIEQYAPELVERTSHLTHGLVKLPGAVKMSSRKGNILKAEEVIKLVRDELKSTYNSEDDKIVFAAIKYAFLKYRIGGNIIFDPKESVKMTGNSGPYLLYSTVRAKKILQNLTDFDEYKKEPEYIYNIYERNLVKKMIEYCEVLKSAAIEMAPHKVANYLYELAQVFSRFYENCPVKGDKSENERGKLVKVYLDTMTHGLNILGIEVPEEM